MRKVFWIAAGIGLSTAFYSCDSLGNIGALEDAANQVLNTSGGEDAKPQLTNDEIIAGLKDALTVGIKNGASKVSQADGFFKNPTIKIPFPPEAQNVEDKARQLGLGNKVDQFVMTLNRAAEEASKDAAPIFIEAIKQMSFQDAMSILRGEENAATEYLKKTTTTKLHQTFKPTVSSAIEKVEVTKYWNPIITKYNMIPGVEKKDPDLDQYVTEKATDGLFVVVAEEEKKIRKDPVARVTDILQKVFGWDWDEE